MIGVAACTVDPVPASPATPPAPLPTAAQVFERSAAAYANARSYADQGEVVDAFRASTGDHVRRVTFATAFVRGDRFRFEFREDGDAARAYVVWGDGSRARKKWFLMNNRVDEVESLGLAIAGATGVSSGAAYSVPTLLLPDVLSGRSTYALDDARVEGIDLVEGRRCYRIAGTIKHPSQTPTRPTERARTIWIDAETYLLLKVLDRSHHPSEQGRDEFDVESTTTYKPLLNTPLTEAHLAEPVAGPMRSN